MNTILIHKPLITELDIKSVNNALTSTFVSGDGPLCRKLEENIANYLGQDSSLFVNSATAGLEIAFRGKGFDERSEVIVPNFTYTSSALGPMYNNLDVVLADVEPDTGNLDADKLESYISSKTVAIVAVDYAGIPCAIDRIKEIADVHNLYVVHDTAQSFGSKYKGVFTGNFFDISTFSLHGTKNLTSGEGGIVTVKDKELLSTIRLMRDKGTDKYRFLREDKTRGYYEYLSIGHSYVQSNINAALGLSQLSQFEDFQSRRRDIASRYDAAFQSLAGFQRIRIPQEAESNWHLYGVLVPNNKRFVLMDALREYGIHANVHYTPLHRNKLFKQLSHDAEMPGTMNFYNRLLRLPIYPAMTDMEIEYVIDKFIAIWNVKI